MSTKPIPIIHHSVSEPISILTTNFLREVVKGGEGRVSVKRGCLTNIDNVGKI